MSLFEKFMNCVENNSYNAHCKECKKSKDQCGQCDVKQRIEKIRKDWVKEPCLVEEDDVEEDELEFIDVEYTSSRSDSDLSIVKKYNLDMGWKDVYDVMNDSIRYGMTREQSLAALELFYKDRNPFPLKERIKDDDLKGRYGRTLLHEAVLAEDEEAIKKLIEDGADPTIRDNSNHTPYILGVLEGKMKAIKLLKSLGVKN